MLLPDLPALAGEQQGMEVDDHVVLPAMPVETDAGLAVETAVQEGVDGDSDSSESSDTADSGAGEAANSAVPVAVATYVRQHHLLADLLVAASAAVLPAMFAVHSEIQLDDDDNADADTTALLAPTTVVAAASVDAAMSPAADSTSSSSSSESSSSSSSSESSESSSESEESGGEGKRLRKPRFQKGTALADDELDGSTIMDRHDAKSKNELLYDVLAVLLGGLVGVCFRFGLTLIAQELPSEPIPEVRLDDAVPVQIIGTVSGVVDLLG
jgi:cobalamin biosynthesis Mg chelatase CobN